MIIDKVKVVVTVAIVIIVAGASQYVKYRGLRKEYEERLRKLPPNQSK